MGASTEDSSPDLGFSSSEPGTILYQGSCSSETTKATAGDNLITLKSLPDGVYSDCSMTVTDAAGNVSNKLTITKFEISAAAPLRLPDPPFPGRAAAEL